MGSRYRDENLGCLYTNCLPREPYVETIPDYNPKGRSASTMKQLEADYAFMKGQWKWHGAVLGSDGVLYAIPSNADQVRGIQPEGQSL